MLSLSPQIPRARGIATTADLLARSRIDTHDPCPYSACWHWLGARCVNDGIPRIHALDYDRVEKRTMSGPRAVMMLSRQAPLKGLLAYRTCTSRDCVNPAHHALARDKVEIGAAIRKDGRRKGTHLEARRASAALGRAAQGIVDTPAHIVAALRAAPRSVTNKALGERCGITRQTVSKVRRGKTRSGAAAAVERPMG